VSDGTRAPGWYPDPWGTGDERYFDGVAWARSTRRPGDLSAPVPGAGGASSPVGDPATSVPTAGWPVPQTPTPSTEPPRLAPETPATGPTVPEGWYQDPWRAAAYRYWDGEQWTGHVSGPSGAQVEAPRLEEERAAGRWAKLALAWGGPALAVTTVTGAFQWHWLAEHWDEITRPGSDIQANGNTGAALAGQVASLVLLVVGVLFLLWFHRAAANAVSAGMHARRSPVLATISFIIPILNLWWPYQSTCDMLPADHPGRVAVRRWWALWVGCTIAGLATAGAAFTLNDIALAVTTAVGVVLAVLAAFAARAVVEEISDAHGQLMTRTA
jgi:Domain of unknown function (DUF4328)/Protein of unknown function (DUF2510)